MWKAKTPQGELPDKTPYSLYFPHTIPIGNRVWNQGYRQIISIDPGRKNYAFRIERRWDDGRIVPIVFDKVQIESIVVEGNNTIINTYKVLTAFLEKYKQFYDSCHYVIIERQLPHNYQAVRISQHTISYFNFVLMNKPLLASIIEIDPKLKGRMLGAPKGTSDSQLKSWAVEKAKGMLEERQDKFSLEILEVFKTKQDDLSDTVCQIEAFFVYLKQSGCSV